MTTATTERIESVIDEVMAAASEQVWELTDMIKRTADGLHYTNRTPRRAASRSYDWTLTTEEVIAVLQQKIADGTIAGYNARGIQQSIERIAAYRAQIEELNAYTRELNEVYYAGPWSRFFLVVGGHIHSSTACHSCYATTRFAWLPSLSGLTEADAVAEHGSILCTHCYPTAPVEWTVSKQGEKPADYYCEGSGKAPTSEQYKAVRFDGREYTGYRYSCSGCGNRVSERQITNSGTVRKHKK